MAENDIYNSKKRFERIRDNISELVLKPSDRKVMTRGQYYCKNKNNLKYYKELLDLFNSKDTSYVRRYRLLTTFNLINYAIDKDLKDCDRKDINTIVAFMHTKYKSSQSKGDFIKDMKYIWKTILPEKDSSGRPDDSIVPYAVRHLKSTQDKSREKLRNDRLTIEEYQKLVTYFSDDLCFKTFITLSLESLGRPQETLYIKIKDVEIYDNYAKLWIAEKGKEGTGFLQCIESYPYLVEWYNKHPLRQDKNAYLFIYTGTNNRHKQLKPTSINKKLKIACRDLGIDKNITCYSLKRNGVTFRRIAGDSDIEIQHTARWTSTRQLKVYDKSDQEDALKIALIKKGIIKSDEERFKQYIPKTKECSFCGRANGFNEEICSQCKRPLDRKKILKMEEKMKQFIDPESIQNLFKTMYKLQKEIDMLKQK